MMKCRPKDLPDLIDQKSCFCSDMFLIDCFILNSINEAVLIVLYIALTLFSTEVIAKPSDAKYAARH